MSVPKPPEDLELKNIIDKLANFVARNGPEFEQMTKQKQKDNPKFSFLFSGEFVNYYQYKVNTEQAVIKQQQQQQMLNIQQQQNLVQQVINQQSVKSAPWQQAVLPPQQSINNNQSNLREQLEQMKLNAKDQILQSENNLNAQYQNLMQQQQAKLEDALLQAKKNQLINMSLECEIPLDEIQKIVQPIIESCTKDAISNGKAWILNNFKSTKHGEFIAYYILERIIDKDSSFELRLHLIYLINDLLHHCTRKNVHDLKDIIENVSVIPSFCLTFIAAHEEGKAKLTKLLTLWENNKYFTPSTIEQMKDPNVGIAAYQAFLLNEHAAVVADVSTTTNNNFMMLQQQHQEFVNHINNQIITLEQQLQQQQQQQPQHQQQQPLLPLPPQQQQPLLQQPPHSQQQQFQQHQQHQQQLNNNNQMDQNFCPPPFNHPIPPGFPMPPPFNHDFPGPAPPLHFPDLSKPPPGFPGAPMGFCPPPNLPPPPMFHPELDLVPTIPYFDLPAGLMAPLVKLGDCEYKSLDPRDIRLPPPMPPTERLLAAVEAFYSPPSHDRPRDADGWEKLSLFEFYKAKNQAKSKKMDAEADLVANKFGVDLQNDDNTDHHDNDNNHSNNINNNLNATNSNSNSNVSITNNNNSAGGGGGVSRAPFNDVKISSSFSRSPSPIRQRRRRTDRSRSYSRSPSRSGSGSESRSRSRSRSRGGSPDQFQDMFYPSVNRSSRSDRLSETNKGHQLMKKMGWGGGALGSTGDGIVDPIDHADVRDKQDQFKGLGMSLNDPFENFRKNKSSGFNVRMRERLDARSTRKGSP